MGWQWGNSRLLQPAPSQQVSPGLRSSSCPGWRRYGDPCAAEGSTIPSCAIPIPRPGGAGLPAGPRALRLCHAKERSALAVSYARSAACQRGRAVCSLSGSPCKGQVKVKSKPKHSDSVRSRTAHSPKAKNVATSAFARFASPCSPAGKGQTFKNPSPWITASFSQGVK